jgi:hypothetical protein
LNIDKGCRVAEKSSLLYGKAIEQFTPFNDGTSLNTIDLAIVLVIAVTAKLSHSLE